MTGLKGVKSCESVRLHVRLTHLAGTKLQILTDFLGAVVNCRYLYCKKQGGPGSVRFGYSLGRERFKRFWFSVLAVPLQKRFFCVS